MYDVIYLANLHFNLSTGMLATVRCFADWWANLLM